MVIKDCLGQELKVSDYILSGYSHKSSNLVPYEIIGITPKGYLKVVHGKWSYAGRSQIQSPQTEAIKITKDQFNSLVK